MRSGLVLCCVVLSMRSQTLLAFLSIVNYLEVRTPVDPSRMGDMVSIRSTSLYLSHPKDAEYSLA